MPGSQRTMLSAATGAPARGEHVRAPSRRYWSNAVRLGR
jgi:hypothetical protein